MRISEKILVKGVDDEILGRNMVKGVIIKGVDDEILRMDLRQMINQFIYNNPEKPIERVREVLENVMSSANKELDFELSEDKNNIRLEVENAERKEV